MEELQSNAKQADFSSLTGIMEHFHRVPFEQFQQDLNNWFNTALSDIGINPENLQIENIPNLSSLPELISKIYHQAELLKTINESKIDLPDGNN